MRERERRENEREERVSLGFVSETPKKRTKNFKKIRETHRVDSARGLLLEDGLDDLVYLGHAGHAPDEENLRERKSCGRFFIIKKGKRKKPR
jgi:hypothetical protein